MDRFVFGPKEEPALFELDESELRKNGTPVKIVPKARKILFELVKHPERRFTSEMIRGIGHAPEGSDPGFAKDYIRLVRDAIGKSAIDAKYIDGYKFNWEVQRVSVTETTSAQTTTRSGPVRTSASHWDAITKECSDLIEGIKRGLEYSQRERFYIARDIENEFDRFLSSGCTAMAIVGESGMGKTTLIAHLAERHRDKHLSCLVLSRELSGTVEGIESWLMKRMLPEALDPNQFWTAINEECLKRGKLLLVLVDAINEFNQKLGLAGHPVQLMISFNRLVRQAHAGYRAVKLVFTCRPEVWQRGVKMNYAEFEKAAGAYYRGLDGITLAAFTENEAERAYSKYRNEHSIRTIYAQLSPIARHLLRDPLFLALATESYANQDIPRELDEEKVFKLYFNRPGIRELKEPIYDLVDEMFDGGDPGVLQRVVIVRDRSLRNRNRALYEDLNPEEPYPGYKLMQERILRHLTAGDVIEFRFNYDRIAEYLISNRFVELIEKRIQRGESRVDAVVAVIASNLSQAQTLSIALGALRQALSVLSRRNNPGEYADILRTIAYADARGMSLAVSACFRGTAQSASGLQILTAVLKSLESSPSFESFPIIIAVYSVLRDEEYRSWLRTQPGLQGSHLDLLYGYFDWGLCLSQSAVADVAVLYLFFLWQRRESLADAIEATGRIVDKVTLLRSSLFAERRRRLVNLTGLMILVLAQTPDPRTHAAAVSVVTRTLGKLQLRGSLLVKALSKALGLLNRVMGKYLIEVLESLRNPINYEELKAYYEDRDTHLPYFERVSLFLIGDCNPAELDPHVDQMVRNPNPFVLQMLTFAISVAWERARSVRDSDLCLRMIRRLAAMNDPVANYCASLALYHINYFGERGNDETMALMKELATQILSERKGMVDVSKSSYNFNIVGTYGRALYKRSSSTFGRELSHAKTALRIAKKREDKEFYLYLCENIGLLGVLIPPENVFDVLTEILCDVGAIERPGYLPAPFPSAFLDEARHTIFQSLANIRALYRQETDRYLFEISESSGVSLLYYEVTGNRAPQFNLATFHSWSFEQLMFRILTRYREEIGIDVIKAFLRGAQQHSAPDCIREMVKLFLVKLVEKAE